MFLQRNAAFDSDADVICLVIGEFYVIQVVALWESAKFQTIAIDAFIEYRKLINQSCNLRLRKTLPHLVAFLVSRKNMVLKKMFISLKKWKLLEQSLPCDLAVVSILV